LMGVLLHFNDDTDKSHTFFEAAYSLSPNAAYAQAFLEAEDDERARRPAAEPQPAPPEAADEEPAMRPQGPELPLDLPGAGQPPPGRRGAATNPPRPRKVPEEPKPRPLAARWHVGPVAIEISAAASRGGSA